MTQVIPGNSDSDRCFPVGRLFTKEFLTKSTCRPHTTLSGSFLSFNPDTTSGFLRSAGNRSVEPESGNAHLACSVTFHESFLLKYSLNTNNLRVMHAISTCHPNLFLNGIFDCIYTHCSTLRQNSETTELIYGNSQNRLSGYQVLILLRHCIDCKRQKKGK